MPGRSLIIAAYRNAHSHRGRAAIADAYEACLQDLVEFMGQAESQPTKPNTGTNVSSQRRRDSRQRRGQQEPWLQQYLAGTHSEDSNHSGDSCDGNDHDHRPSDWGQFERLATAGKGQQQEAQQGYSHPWSLCLRIEPQHGLVPAYMGLVRGVIGSKPVSVDTKPVLTQHAALLDYHVAWRPSADQGIASSYVRQLWYSRPGSNVAMDNRVCVAVLCAGYGS